MIAVAMPDVRSSKDWTDVEFERYLAARRRRILGDPGYTRRQKALLTDEEILDTGMLKEMFGQSSPQAIWQWRSPQDKTKAWPHPAVLAPADKDLGEVWGKTRPGVQAGRALEWGIHSGRFRWDPDKDDYVRVHTYRHGRPWSDVVRTRVTTTKTDLVDID